MRSLVLLIVAAVLCGCSLAEWGNVAADAGGLFDGVQQTLPDGTLEPDGWSLLQWNTGGAIGAAVAAIGYLFRRSAARGFGKAVEATKGLLKR